MTTKEKEIFTTEEAAEMMGCSPSTIEEPASFASPPCFTNVWRSFRIAADVFIKLSLAGDEVAG